MPRPPRTPGPVRTATRRGALLGAGVAAVLALAAGVAVTATVTPGGLPTAPAAVRLGLPLARLLTDAAGVAAAGVAVLPLLLAGTRPALADPIRRSAARVGIVAGAAWMLAAAVSGWLAAADLTGQGLGIGSGPVTGYLLTTSGGRALLVTAGGALAYTLLTALGLRRPRVVPAGLPAVAAGLGLLPLPVTGHAADGGWRDLTMLAVGLHTVGAAAWLGGLGAVFALAGGRRALLADALPRFSAVAGAALAVVGVSGLAMLPARLADQPGQPLAALFGTGYGWLLLGKFGCLLAVALLGGYTRLRLLPAVLRHRRTATGGWIGVELVLLSVALGFAAALARAPVGG